MNHRKTAYAFVLLLVMLAGCSRYVTVTVMNATDQRVGEIRIHYTGGAATIPELQPKEHGIARINPSGESSLHVRYVDATGVAHSKDADIYLEPGYTGTISVEIRSQGDVRFKSNVEVQ